MFKTAETGLYVTAVIGVIAIFLVTMFAMGGLPWTVGDSDLTGDAKAMFVQQRGISPHPLDEISHQKGDAHSESNSLFERRGLTIEQVPQDRLRKGSPERAPIRDPRGGSDDLPEVAPEEEGGSWDSFYNDCMNGLAEGEVYFVNDVGNIVPAGIPSDEICGDYADYMMAQINAVSHGASCSGGSGNRFSHAYTCGSCTCLEYDVCFCEDGEYNCNTGASATNEVC